MNYIIFFMTFFIAAITCAEDLYFPENFKKIVPIEFPMSVGRSSWQGAYFPVREDASAGKEMWDKIFKISSGGFFSGSHPDWNAVNDKNAEKKLHVGRLACPVGISCYLISRSSDMTFLVTEKNYRIIDAKLVYASYPIRSDEGEYVGSGSLDSIFGDGIFWRQLPVTRFEQTGIFCSSFIDEVKHVGKNFKRRVNPEGYIESIEVSDWRDCKAPW